MRQNLGQTEGALIALGILSLASYAVRLRSQLPLFTGWLPMRHFADWGVRAIVTIGFLLASGGSEAAGTRVLKCTAADGTVSYLDARSCPGAAAAEERAIPEHRVTLTAQEKSRQRWADRPAYRMTDADRARNRAIAEALLRANGAAPSDSGSSRPAQSVDPNSVSFRCSAAGGIWYSHQRCPERIGVYSVEVTDEYGHVRSEMTSGVPVTQEQVSRSLACKEIHSARALDRPGHRLDEHTTSYDKLKGKDRC
jgi:hypothetical protein